MTIRRAKIEDAKNLFDWRNDADTRTQSINNDPIEWESHLAWLTKTLKNPDRVLFIFEVENSPAGTCRIDREVENNQEVYELSWTIAPNWRGKGLGKKMLKELLEVSELSGKMVKAVIKKENVASVKMAEGLGFVRKVMTEPGIWYKKID